jgi:hypothetical protein
MDAVAQQNDKAMSAAEEALCCETSSGEGGHFISKSSYRGDMHVGVPATASVVGNQPEQSSSDINFTGKPAIPGGE